VKLLFMMYLEEDDALVQARLEALEVTVYSRISLEGHGTGAVGWYGDVAPFQSRMVFAVLPEDQARRLLEAVRTWTGGADPAHPVRAFVVGIEDAAVSS